jgi:hypothetical protein
MLVRDRKDNLIKRSMSFRDEPIILCSSGMKSSLEHDGETQTFVALKLIFRGDH